MQTRRERIRQQTIKEIKAIAFDTVNGEGVEKITIHGIARQMGMTPPAFYSYFKNRDELLKVLVIDAYRSFRDALTDARDSIAENNCAGRIYGVYKAYRDWSVQHPNMFGLFAARQVYGFKTGDPQILAQADKVYMIFADLFEAAWQKGIVNVKPLKRRPPASFVTGFNTIKKKLKLTLPLEVYHQVFNLTVMIHGLISMELSERLKGITGEMSLFYRYQLLEMMAEFGIAYDPDN